MPKGYNVLAVLRLSVNPIVVIPSRQGTILIPSQDDLYPLRFLRDNSAHTPPDLIRLPLLQCRSKPFRSRSLMCHYIVIIHPSSRFHKQIKMSG